MSLCLYRFKKKKKKSSSISTHFSPTIFVWSEKDAPIVLFFAFNPKPPPTQWLQNNILSQTGFGHCSRQMQKEGGGERKINKENEREKKNKKTQ